MKLQEKQIKYTFNSQALLQQNDAVLKTHLRSKVQTVKGERLGKEFSELFLAAINGCAEPCYESYRVMGGE